MRADAFFPSEYLKAADLQGKQVTVVIDHVEMRDVGDDHKPVLFFQGKSKGVVLNKTNTGNISAIYGNETEDWTGKEVVLYEAMVPFQGKDVPSIRIKAPYPRTKGVAADVKDEIPW